MITLRLIPDHGDPIEIVAGTRDVYVWERTNTSKGKTFAQLEANPAITDMYEIAWHAARRQGLFTGKLEDFVAAYEIESKEEAEEEQQPAPFPQAPTAAPSSGSPSKPASRRASGSTRGRKP